MLGLAVFSVLLRFVVRFTSRTQFQLQHVTIADWLILFAVVLFVIFAALLIDCRSFPSTHNPLASLTVGQ